MAGINVPLTVRGKLATLKECTVQSEQSVSAATPARAIRPSRQCAAHASRPTRGRDRRDVAEPRGLVLAPGELRGRDRPFTGAPTALPRSQTDAQRLGLTVSRWDPIPRS